MDQVEANCPCMKTRPLRANHQPPELIHQDRSCLQLTSATLPGTDLQGPPRKDAPRSKNAPYIQGPLQIHCAENTQSVDRKTGYASYQER